MIVLREIVTWCWLTLEKVLRSARTNFEMLWKSPFRCEVAIQSKGGDALGEVFFGQPWTVYPLLADCSPPSGGLSTAHSQKTK